MGNPLNDYFDRTYDSLYNKITAYVIVKCNSIYDVEDIVQEIFSELYRLIKAKGCDYINNPEAMAMRIANFKLIRFYSQKKKRNELSLVSTNSKGEEYSDFQISDVDIETEFITNETVNEIWKQIKLKSSETQKIFALFYYCDMPIKEIAKNLNVSESFVKHRIYRTLKELRVLYLKEGDKL